MNVRSPLPSAFRRPYVVQLLGSIATAAALAASFGAAVHGIWGGSEDGARYGSICAATTMIAAIFWMALLRMARPWVSVVLSVLLAASNSVAAVFLGIGDGNLILETFLFALGYGAIVWVPSLLVAWIFFGLPTMLSRQSEPAGSTAVDKRETVVGVIAAFAGLLATALTSLVPDAAGRKDAALILGLGLVALVLGSASLVVIGARKRAREHFVDTIGRGEDSGVRIAAAAGRVFLVQTVHMDTTDYRNASSYDQPLAELDDGLRTYLERR